MFPLVSKRTYLSGIVICLCTALTCGQNSKGTDWSEASSLLSTTFIESLSHAVLWTQHQFFQFPFRKNSPLKSWCPVRCVDGDSLGVFPLLWTPPNRRIPTVKFLPRRRDVHVNWSLMFSQHFPVGSDSLRLSSASSPFLTADTGRLTYPQEADVFSCWSHSILITWECSIARLIYLFPNATG